jgi:hypothetical protein
MEKIMKIQACHSTRLKRREAKAFTHHSKGTNTNDPKFSFSGACVFLFCNCFGLSTAKEKEGFIRKYVYLSLMSGSTIVEVGGRGHPSLEGERRSKK